MIKLCGISLCKPLEIIFKSGITKGELPSEWKKATVIPVLHNRNDKQSLKNYIPISLLLIFGEMFERIVCDVMFEYFKANNLNSLNQSGFKPGNSCLNQLLSITHEIYQSFNKGFEVRGVFLDILKAFDKLYNDGKSIRNIWKSSSA